MPDLSRGLLDSRAWPLLLTLVVAILVAYFAWPVLSGGGEVVFVDNGDGWKNLYTFAYHVLHDTDPTHSMAMNWPHGEHVSMGDGQFSLSEPLRWLASTTELSPESVLYFVMVAPLASILACAVLVYANFRCLGATRAAAAAWALPLTLLQPQHLRLPVHFGLAYAICLPLLLYLWQRARQRDYPLRHGVVAGLVLAFFGLAHFYNLAIGAALVTALLALDGLLFRRDRLRAIAASWAAQVLLPLVICFSVVYCSDVHADRVANPYGLDVYVSRFQALFADLRFPWWRWLERVGAPVGEVNYEGQAYLGFFVAVGVLCALLAAAFGVLRKRDPRAYLRRHGLSVGQRGEVLALLFGAGGLLAIYSWGWPLAAEGAAYDFLRAHAGPLKQFRGLGRFSWAPYYCLGIVGVIGLRAILDTRGWRFGLLGTAYVLTVVEGVAIWALRPLPYAPHPLAAVRADIGAALDAVDAEAILPIPMYHIGSENFNRDQFGKTIYTSTYASLVGGVPNAGVYLSRTSFSQSRRGIELAQPYFNVPAPLADGDPNATYVLAIDAATYRSTEWVRGVYGAVVDLARPLYEDDVLMLRALPAARLDSVTRLARRRYLDTYYGGLRLDTLRSLALFGERGLGVVRVDFDDRDNAAGMYGTGGVDLAGVYEPTLLTDSDIPVGAGADRALHISLQLYAARDGEVFAPVRVAFVNDAGAELNARDFVAFHHVASVRDGWAQVAFDAPVPPGARRVRVSVLPSANAEVPGGRVDELTMAPVGLLHAYPLAEPAPLGAYLVYGQLFAPL